MEQPPGSSLGPWSTGLFDCFQDINSSCELSGTMWTLLVCACLSSCCYTAWTRTKMRRHYSLRVSPCNDCILHLCCQHCATCQEYRELVNRGYDMSLGWEGNVERHNKMVAMMPQPTVQWSMVR